MVVMAIGPVMAWRHGRTTRLQPVVICAIAGSAIACLALLSFEIGFGVGPLVALGLIGWLSASIGADIWLRPTKSADFSARLKRLPRDVIGMWVAHFGIIIFMLGAVGDSLFNSEQVVRANPGDVIKIADRNVTFTGIQQVHGPNYQAIAAQLEYRDEAGNLFAVLTPEKRIYSANGKPQLKQPFGRPCAVMITPSSAMAMPKLAMRCDFTTNR